MSKRANPTLIGAFVVGAVAIVIAVVVALIGSALFREKPHAVAYFEGSVDGLLVGAPVTWLGVRIGEVTEVRVELDAVRHSVDIPVFMEFDPDRINIVGGSADLIRVTDLIKRGLRAQLQLQGLVTGQKFVDLSMRPETPERRHRQYQSDTMPEIPTIKSQLDTLEESIERLPLKDIGEKIADVLLKFDDLLASGEMKKTLTEVAGSAEELHAVLASVDGKRDAFPLLKAALDNLDKAKADLDSINEGLAGRQGIGKDAHDTIDALHAQIAPTGEATRQVLDAAHVALGDAHVTLTADVHKTLDSTQATLRSIQSVLVSLDSVIAPTSQQRTDLDQILRNLAYTSQALRGFSEQLDRNPSALLTGKK